MAQNLQENKMGTMPIGKLLFNMSAPMVASMAFQAFYNIVDSVVVSQISQDALNAVSLAFPLQMLVISCANGIGVGINALVSKSLGAKDNKGANQAASVGFFIYFVAAAIFAVIGLTVPELFYKSQTDNEMIIKYGKDYLSVICTFAIALFMQMGFEKLLQATGKTNLSMISQVSGALINIILDPIMTLGLLGFPRLEVLGAAIATVIGQSVAVVISCILCLKKNPEIQLDKKEIKPNKAITIQILKVGVPSFIMQGIGSVMNYAMNLILISFTEAATAVFGVLFKLQSFVIMPVIGVNAAVIPILSYNYGAKNLQRIKEVIKTSTIIAVAMMGIGTVVFELAPHFLISIFNPSEEMMEIGIKALRIVGTHYPIAGVSIMMGAACQALGKPLYSMITSIARQIGILIPIAYIMSLLGNLDLIWLSFPIAEAVAAIMTYAFKNKTIRAVEKQLSSPFM